MKTFIAYRKNQGLYNPLRWLIAFTFIIVWLPLLRALFDGESYEWGHQYFGLMFRGKGLSLDYLMLIAELCFYAFLYTSMYWVKNRKVFYGAAIIWFIHVFGNLIFDIITADDVMFHGDTLNVHVSLSTIIIPLSLVALTLILVVIWKDQKASETHIPWTSRNTRLALFILGPLPIQAILFYVGEPHGISDQIGVIISLIQAFAIPYIFVPKTRV